MKIVRSEVFKKDFKNLPKNIQQRFERKIKIFTSNPRHPSFRTKKMGSLEKVWEASIDMNYRFTFEIYPDYYLLRRIGPHDRVLKTP